MMERMVSAAPCQPCRFVGVDPKYRSWVSIFTAEVAKELRALRVVEKWKIHESAR
jgi:hypothetical protein